MGIMYDDTFIALARPDPLQDFYGRIFAARDSLFLAWTSRPRQLPLDFAELTRIGYTLGFLQVCWVNACRDSNIYRKGVRALWDLKVTLRPHHAVPQKAYPTPIMPGHWSGYSSPPSWQQMVQEMESSSDWNNGRDNNRGKRWRVKIKYKSKNNGGNGDGYNSGSANSSTTQQIMGTLGTIVRAKIQAKEKQTGL